MKKLLIGLFVLTSVSAFSSDCNIQLTGNLNAKNTDYAWELLLDKGYYQLGFTDAQIKIESSETGSLKRLIMIDVLNSKLNKTDEASSMGSNELGVLNPGWKTLIRRAVNKLTDCRN